jgi:signal transduction histidine kinase
VRRLINDPLFRLTWSLPLAATAVLALLIYPIYRTSLNELDDTVRGAVEEEILGLETILAHAGMTGLIGEISQRVEDARDAGAIYLLTDANGRPLAGNLQMWPPGAPVTDEAWFNVPEHGRHDNLEGEVFLLDNDQRLLVGRRSPTKELRHKLMLNSAVGLLAAFALCGLISWMSFAQLRRRFSDLGRRARIIQDSDRAQRLPMIGDAGELDQLVTQVNRAFDSLEQLMQASRQLTTAIAHDMRRPAIELRNEIDQVLRTPNLPPQTRSVLENAVGKTDDMLATFAALLRLARLEAGAYGSHMGQVELGQLVESVADLYRPAIALQQRELIVQAQPVLVWGDGELLVQLVVNLLENALRYGTGTITIAVRSEQLAVIEVADQGFGVPQADLEKVFERFYRVDPARSETGSGLGLSLVQAIAAYHSGSASVHNLAPGFVARVLLPLFVPHQSESVQH